MKGLTVDEYDEAREKVIKGSVKDLYVKNLKVISKKRNLAKLRELHSKREIYLYGAKGLKEGGIYNFIVYGVKNYKGMQEIVEFRVQSQSQKKLP